MSASATLSVKITGDASSFEKQLIKHSKPAAIYKLASGA